MNIKETKKDREKAKAKWAKLERQKKCWYCYNNMRSYPGRCEKCGELN